MSTPTSWLSYSLSVKLKYPPYLIAPSLLTICICRINRLINFWVNIFNPINNKLSLGWVNTFHLQLLTWPKPDRTRPLQFPRAHGPTQWKLAATFWPFTLHYQPIFHSLLRKFPDPIQRLVRFGRQWGISHRVIKGNDYRSFLTSHGSFLTWGCTCKGGPHRD